VIPPPGRFPLRGIRRCVALGVFVVLLLSACGGDGGGSLAAPAARVGSDEITQTELQHNIPLFTFLETLTQQPCGQPDTASHETQSAACARFTLTNLIQEDLVDQYAATNKISVPSSQVSSTTQQLEDRVGGHDQLAQLLSQQHLSFPDLTELTKRLLLFNEVRRDIASKNVSDDELKQQYEQNKSQYTELHAAHILVKDEATADKISKMVNKQNFAKLAEKYSTDTGSAQKGGDLGTIQAGQLDPTFVQAALALKPGEISKPVQTQFGWHIIMLISAQTESFTKVRGQLLDQQAAQSFDTWLQGELKDTTIDVNPRYGRLNEQTGAVDPITSTATGSATPTPSATPSAPASP
jgi:foldase protein PrsA